MTTTEQTATPMMPPLDTLLALAPKGDVQGWKTLACVVLAMLNGATWRHVADHAWPWKFNDAERELLALMCDFLPPASRLKLAALPNPFTDDDAGAAEAYRLEMRELVKWEEYPPHGHHHAWPTRTALVWGPEHPDRRMAAVLAVLHKHKQHPTLAPLIRHLLENVP